MNIVNTYLSIDIKQIRDDIKAQRRTYVALIYKNLIK